MGKMDVLLHGCLLLFLCIIKRDEAAITWMCRDWPLSISCDDSSKILIHQVEFEALGNQETCKTIEGLTPSPLLSLYNSKMKNCSSAWGKHGAVNTCNDRTKCTISASSLFFKTCDWPGNALLRIEYQCKKIFKCPRELVAISTQRISRNLQRRPAAWFRDPVHNTEAIFLMPWTRLRENKVVYQFSTLTSFVLGRPYKVYRLPFASAGTSLVAYDGHLYFIRYKTRNIAKYCMKTRQKAAERAVTGALYKHEIEYSGLAGSSDIELATDENGLWAIYTTDTSRGNIVISRINTADLTILSSWETKIQKQNLLNVFVICGTLYTVDKTTLRVREKFETANNITEETASHVNITIPSRQTTSINYNPSDNTLYVWSTSQAIMFTLDTKTPSSHHDLIGRYSRDRFLTTSVNSTTRSQVFDSGKSIKGVITPSSTTRSLPEESKCSATEREGIFWPEALVNTVANQECPGGARGFMTWKCVVDGHWNPVWEESGPDLDGCSTWTISIDEELKYANSTEVLREIAEEFSSAVDNLTKSRMQGHDLRHASMIMSEISNIATFSPNFEKDQLDLANDVESERKRDQLIEINQALVDSGSDLVSDEMDQTWHKLDSSEKRHIGNRIMGTVEKSAFLLAGQEEKLLEDENVTAIDHVLEKENILVGIKIQKVENNGTNSTNDSVTFPDKEKLQSNGSWNKVSDSIQISTLDIRANQQDGKTAVVFALYDRLAELMDGDVENGNLSSRVNSRIVSATIHSANHRVSLQSPAIITLEHVKESNKTHTCVYWNPEAKNLEEKWLTDGCSLISHNSSHTVCACHHLTSFAVLVNHKGYKFKDHMTILDLLTWIGLSASLVCLAVCIVTFIYFRSLHCTRTTIHTNLCICLFISQLVFLVGIDMYELRTACSVIAGILHYCFLATFMWMALEGFQLYVMLVEVFEKNTNIVWYYIVGYGVPAVFVGLSAGLNPMGYGTETACWLKTDVHGEMGTIGGFSPFIWAFIGPASLVAIGNIAFLILTAVTMYRHGRKYIYYSKLQAIRSALRGTLALLFLLGTTWIIGILWWWDGMVLLSYLFCILNAFQGVYIFVFHCLMHNKVRYEYRIFLSSCLGDEYTDLPNSSSLTMKYSGMRRRSTQTFYSQRHKYPSSFKGSVRSNNEMQSPRSASIHSPLMKNFSEASKNFTSEDRTSMQILLGKQGNFVPSSGNNSLSSTTNSPSHHPHTLSTQSCPIRFASMKHKPPLKKVGSCTREETVPFKRSYSERRASPRKYNAPVSDGVNRILKSARSTHSVLLPSQYPYASNPQIASDSLSRDRSNIQNNEIRTLEFSKAPSSLDKKESKFVDKRIAKLKNSSFQFKRSSSMNSAEKKRRDIQKLQMQMEMQPSSSVPDLMSQLSAKIESRDISNVLLMYLDKDGTLNRARMNETRRSES